MNLDFFNPLGNKEKITVFGLDYRNNQGFKKSIFHCMVLTYIILSPTKIISKNRDKYNISRTWNVGEGETYI